LSPKRRAVLRAGLLVGLALGLFHLLGDFLESGFNDLGYSCEDIEEAHL